MKRWVWPAISLLLGLIAGALLILSPGRSLGLYLGALGWIALIVPYLALITSILRIESPQAPPIRQILHRVLYRHQSPTLFTVGIGLIWLAAAPAPLLSTLQAWLVLVAFCVALTEASHLLHRLFSSRVLCAALIVGLALLWLTCPIWLSHLFQSPHGQKLANILIPIHPLFALNGVLKTLGAWPEQSLAYRLTNIGQDVSYLLPASVAWCVLLHLLLALFFAQARLSFPLRRHVARLLQRG